MDFMCAIKYTSLGGIKMTSATTMHVQKQKMDEFLAKRVQVEPAQPTELEQLLNPPMPEAAPMPEADQKPSYEDQQYKLFTGKVTQVRTALEEKISLVSSTIRAMYNANRRNTGGQFTKKIEVGQGNVRSATLNMRSQSLEVCLDMYGQFQNEHDLEKISLVHKYNGQGYSDSQVVYSKHVPKPLQGQDREGYEILGGFVQLAGGITATISGGIALFQRSPTAAIIAGAGVGAYLFGRKLWRYMKDTSPGTVASPLASYKQIGFDDKTGLAVTKELLKTPEYLQRAHEEYMAERLNAIESVKAQLI